MRGIISIIYILRQRARFGRVAADVLAVLIVRAERKGKPLAAGASNSAGAQFDNRASECILCILTNTVHNIYIVLLYRARGFGRGWRGRDE